MSDTRVILFAGTLEGRLLAERLEREKIQTIVCVATEYGEQLLCKGRYVQVRVGRLGEDELVQLFHIEHPAVVVDATHPYAVLVTRNLRRASRQCNCPYLRLQREPSHQFPEQGTIVCSNAGEAAKHLEGKNGNIFLTTGSKELEEFLSELSDKTRVYARILPSVDNLQTCLQLGLEGRQMVCMQGPFSMELNLAMLRHCKASWLVTKDSGAAGGFQEKWEAAHSLGIPCVVIRRPAEDEGDSCQKVWEKLAELLAKKEDTCST